MTCQVQCTGALTEQSRSAGCRKPRCTDKLAPTLIVAFHGLRTIAAQLGADRRR